MAAWYMVPLLVGQAAVTGYGLWLSYQNVARLQKYEEMSKKAAEWSNTAAERLYKTRATQTGAAVSQIVSAVSTITLLFVESRTLLLTAPFVNAVILGLSRQHMANFWDHGNQTQVPFVTQWNEAVKGSEESVGVLGTSALVWAVSGTLWWALG